MSASVQMIVVRDLFTVLNCKTVRDFFVKVDFCSSSTISHLIVHTFRMMNRMCTHLYSKLSLRKFLIVVFLKF